ncbi:HAD-IB family hydrolase [Streptomyces sp. SCUT-3]|uniref:HAD family hydrolase n=1 Tax=Streptomyces sp. SCUT-3 TaxID=2684469 RepID=UPI0015F7A312|nr:HAD-IB family hydrolase [Streptomyces sp. SCUT-3]QMV22634.1 HAD-IB family hydrolase [Streptomyces sp. SCUT-3]
MENLPSPRTAAFFDLDKTVIAKSSTGLRALLLPGRPDQPPGRAAHRLRAVRSCSAAPTTTRWRGCAKYLSELCRGWNVQQVREIVAEALHALIDPIIYDEAASLIEEHHAAGRDVVIVSASGAEVVEPIGRMLGADHVVATRMVAEEGCYTGEVEYYVYGPTKAEAVRELAASEGTTWRAATPTATRSRTCRCWRRSVTPARSSDRALRREAAERGWPVLSFNRPVRLHRRMPSLSVPSAPVLAAAALGAAALGAGLVWYSSRRRRPSVAS